MDNNILLGILKEIISENIDKKIEQEKINNDTSVIELGMDSLEFIKIVVAIEVRLGFDFDVEDLYFENFQTVGSFIDYINNNL